MSEATNSVAANRPLPVSTLPVLVCFVDAQRRYKFNNGAWRDWFGVDPESLTGRPVSEVVGDVRYQLISPFIDRALAGEQVSFETVIPTADGIRRHGQVAYVPQVGPDGTVNGFYAMVTDVSEMKLSQQALKDSQALYQSLVDHLPMCILRKDSDGRVTFGNKEFFRYSGKTPADIIGKTDFDFYPPDLAAKYRTDDLRVLDHGETFTDIEAHRTPAGEQKFVQVLKAPIHDSFGQIIGVQVLFWDVSDRKLAEEQVRESMARKRAIFDAALDCIVLADVDGKIIDFNLAAEQTFGYRRDDVVGRNMDELLFPPEARAEVQAACAFDPPASDESPFGKRIETVATRQTGQRFDVELATQNIPMSGKMVFALFLRDITSRKQAQRDLADKNKELETLLYVISHDLREPLRSIESFAHLLHDKFTGHLEDKARDFLRRIIDGTKRLDRLIDDVVKLSQAQRSQELTDNLSARHLVNEVLKQLEATIESSHATITVADDLPTLCVDRRWARQAIYNLVSNALKFHRPSEPPVIHIVAYSPRGNEPAGRGIEVHDRGLGIDPADADRIFGLFQRAVGREFEGTGAGLAIVRQVANRHGGHAWVRPRSGGGSEFVITFS